MNDYTDIADFVTAQKLELAARNLQHLMKIQNEQVTIDKIVDSLQSSVIDAHANNPTDLCDMMVTQARIMDAVFQFYLAESAGKYTEHEKIATAMRAQAQMIKTVNTWKRLKTETYIKRKIIKYYRPEDQNPQNELMDFGDGGVK